MTYAPALPSPRRLTLGQLWFSFAGRAARSDYWLRFALIYMVAMGIAGVLDQMVPLYVVTVETDGGTQTAIMPVIESLFAIFCIWPSLAVGVKRCHDRDRSGWFLLVALIPAIGGLWLLVDLGFLRGTIGANRFGPDPVA